MSHARKLLILCLGAAVAACQGGGTGDGGSSANGVAPANTTGSAGGGTGAQAQTIGASLGSTPELSSLAQAVQRAGLSETLAGAGPYTLFAPVNQAFGSGAPQDQAQLVALISGHIVPGTITAQDLSRAVERGEGGRAEVATIAGNNLTVLRDGDALVIDNGSGSRVRLVGQEQIGSNGVIHRIDGLIAAPAARSGGSPQ